jgi:predicted transcriptional regulator of viral defense system
MSASKADKVLKLLGNAGIVRASDLKEHGVPREYLPRLHRRGLVERIGRGLYVLRDAEITENRSIAEACKKVPQGVICLLSALRIHGLTTQLPFEVWMAIDRRARFPKLGHPKLRVVRFSGEALSAGVETRSIEHVSVKVYSIAKTVADCFKYRNKIGLDVALEALREALHKRTCSVDDLWHYAKICRVSKVIRPYLEAVV